MKKASEVFKSIRFAKLDPKHDKGPKMSTDDEEHYTVGEKEFDQQVKHAKKRAMQEEQSICQHCQHDPCICDDSHGFVTETKRMSAAVKLQRAFEREQSKSAASRGRMATAKEQDDALERTKKQLSKPETMAVLKRLKNEHIEEGVVGAVKKIWKAIGDFDSMSPKYDGNTRRRQEQRKRLEAKKPVRESYNGYHNNRTGFAKREREDDEYHNGPDPVKHTFTHTVSKEGGEKHQRTVTTGLTTRPKHEFEKVARQHLEKQGYTIHEEIEIQEGRMADKAAGDLDYHPQAVNSEPFDGPYKKKSSATPGKHGSGYSTARHLARQAMAKVAKTKLKEDSELSRKAQIVKSAAKKSNKSEDKFEPNPVLSKHSGTSDK